MSDVDVIDSKLSKIGVTHGDSGAAMATGDGKYVYKTDHRHRGKFLIVNNKSFQQHTGMSERTGTDEDAKNLEFTFRTLGFDVKRADNLTTSQMLKLVTEAMRESHQDADCFGMALLSHGEQGVVYGVDGIIEIDKLIGPVKKCPSLAGKPKLFFIQACRGTELDEGVTIQSDAEAMGARDKIARIPLEADFLYAFSTVPGYFSWRNSSKGSWFVQALCSALNNPANVNNLDIGRILTRVSHQVAYEFESNAAQAHMTRKKQVPSIMSMLTKDFYFTKK